MLALSLYDVNAVTKNRNGAARRMYGVYLKHYRSPMKVCESCLDRTENFWTLDCKRFPCPNEKRPRKEVEKRRSKL